MKSCFFKAIFDVLRGTDFLREVRARSLDLAIMSEVRTRSLDLALIESFYKILNSIELDLSYLTFT